MADKDNLVIRFQCLNKVCNFTQEFLEEDDPDACPVCDSKRYRVTFLKESGAEINSRWGANHPRWSTSMGVPAGQVNDFRKRFPGSTYSNDGRLLIKNRTDKKRQMAERFMYEQD